MYIPPIDRIELLNDVRAMRRDAVKAFVDDTYLGYITRAELQTTLAELAMTFDMYSSSQGAPPSAMLYCQLVAECLACRKPSIVSTALASLESHERALADADVLRECLGVGEVRPCCCK